MRKIADIWSQTLSPNHFRRARYNAQFSSVSFLKILTQLFVPSKDLEGNSLIITNVTSKRITQNREMSIKSPDCRSKKKKNEFYLQLPIYNNSHVDDLYIFLQDLYVYRFLEPGCFVV